MIFLHDLVDVICQQDIGSETRKRRIYQDSAPRKRAKTLCPEEKHDSFKNVRWTMEAGTSDGTTAEEEISENTSKLSKSLYV
jgi:hypothetical protein